MRNALLPTEGLSTTTAATGKIDKTVGIPMRGDIRKIAVHIDATMTFSAGTGTAGQLLKKFCLKGNGATPVYNFEPYSATQDGVASAVNQFENKVTVMNEALVTTETHEAKFVFNCQRIRGLWKSMSLQIQTFTPAEIGLTNTVNATNIKVLVVYGFCDYSVRLSNDSKNATTMNFEVPSSEGVLMGYMVTGATAHRITQHELKDPTGASVNEGEFDTLTALQQTFELRTSTGNGEIYNSVEVPDMAVDENTKIKVQQGTAELVQIQMWFKSAIQQVTNPAVDYRTLAYGAVGKGDVTIHSLKEASNQVAFVSSKPFGPSQAPAAGTTVGRDNLKGRVEQ